jgi:hypothetical protein
MRQQFVISVLLVIVLAACIGTSPAQQKAQQQRDVMNLSKSFAILEQLQVWDYRNQDWCKNIFYRRGKFSDNIEQATCNLFEGKSQPFDAQAQRNFRSVDRAIASTGVKLLFISGIKYAPNGKLIGGEFHLDSGLIRNHYVYSPGYKKLPDDVPNESWHTAIDRDWYYVKEDWN